MAKSIENPFSVDHPKESSGFLLWQVTSLWQRGIKKALEPHEITHSQFVLMASIHWFALNHQEATQVALSNHTKIDPMTTSTVLRTLQQKGFIKRQEHQTDTRAKTVSLTNTGKTTIQKAVVAVEAFDKEFFSILGTNVATINENLLVLLTNLTPK